MSAMEITANAAGNRLTSVVLPIPTVTPGEVLVRVAYVGLNRADIMQCDGKYPAPAGASPLPGLEVSGTLAALGAETHGWQVGQPVCALLAGGGYAEYVAVPAGQLLAIPPALSMAEAAAVPEAAATSIMALHMEAALQPCERVLIHGGTSGLGLMMIQLAKAWGAEVFTTVGSDEKVAFLAPFGITALNHRITPFTEQIMQLTHNQGIDIIIDTLGGPHAQAHLSLLRLGGRMVSLAMMEGGRVEAFSMARLITNRLRWSGTTLRNRTTLEKANIMQQVAQLVMPHLLSGAVRPVIDRVFSLAEAEKALAAMQERLHMGKILLEVQAK